MVWEVWRDYDWALEGRNLTGRPIACSPQNESVVTQRSIRHERNRHGAVQPPRGPGNNSTGRK